MENNVKQFWYDEDLVSRILTTEGFELNDLSLNQIKPVPMHQYGISTKEKPLLLIDNLQVCIGLYAYSKNFAFAAHLNPVAISGDEFECDTNQNIVYCNRIDDLSNAIMNTEIEGPVYIGVSIGFNPIEKTYQVVDLLNKSIDELVSKLNTIGIEAIKLDLRNDHIFIVDSENEKLLTPSNQNTQTPIKK